MNITVDEMVDINNRINKATEESYKKGVMDERERVLPKNLFDALVQYGTKTKTLIDYNKSSSKTDRCNWIQLKPTRDGAKGIKCVEISFEENLTEIYHIGIVKD